MIPILRVGCLLMLFVVASAPNVAAQLPLGKKPQDANASAETEEAETNEEVDALLKVLKDEEQRERLIRRLEESQDLENGATEPGQFDLPPGAVSRTLWQKARHVFGSAWKQVRNTVSSYRAFSDFLFRLASSLALAVGAYGIRWGLRRYVVPRLNTPRTLSTLASMLLCGGTACAILLLWGVQVGALLTSPLGRRFAGSFATILLVVVGSYSAWEMINRLVSKRLLRLAPADERLKRRVETVVPLVRNACLVVIWVLAVLVILSEIGVDIAPLLAGAGIAGLAVGFGAQALIKDLLTGLFVLMENTINVGDWVLLDNLGGQVEKLRIRNVSVRDIYGNLQTVSWSSVVTITNQTRDFGFAVVEVGMAYRENVDEVVEVVKQIAAEMRESPATKDGMLGDLQILGLIELGDSAVVVRTRFKTKPFLRWRLERDFRRRIKNRFDELGIEIPFPHQTIYFGQDKQGQASPLRLKRVDGESAE